MQVPHDGENALRPHSRPVTIGVRQDNDEFFAPEAASDVALAGILLQCLGEFAQYAVAGIMAEGVVEALEMVEVHHQHAETRSIAFATGHLPVEGLFEKTPVVKSRQDRK